MMRKRRSGFTLLELLVVMAALGLFLVLVAGLLTGLLKMQRGSSEDFNRLLVQNALADRFRADVAEAVSAPESLGEQKAGPDCLILQKEDKSHLIYHWNGQNLERVTETKGQSLPQRQPVGGEQITASFERGGPGQRLLSMRLQGEKYHVVFAAALGGDLR